jgi:AAA domain, putative AbiEii toxin, Type IV TA system
MAWGHSVAAVVIDATDQQGIGFGACDRVIVALVVELGLHRVKEIMIEDGGLLAGEDLAQEGDLADVEPIAEKMGERAAGEWDAANRASGPEGSHLGDDPSLAEVGHQQVEAAKLQIPPKDGPDPFGFLFNHDDLAVLGLVSERGYAADPQPLALGGRDLVADARTADVGRWAEAGEELLDLRRQGPFKGRGTLGQLADAALKVAWETGDPQVVSAAMASFRSEHQDALLERSPIPKSEEADYREWSKRFAKWLYGTDHIKIQYSIDYDGLDIRKLSPGTRGIILLLLYLALDDADDRPLIIDQPEENLDPKSIFDELVGLFLQAKSKRQVIMVTHNANLVVNADADQIIVAQAGPHVPGELPPISYFSGGLETADIRKAVCDILEGGEHAFRERARRLRVALER